VPLNTPKISEAPSDMCVVWLLCLSHEHVITFSDLGGDSEEYGSFHFDIYDNKHVAEGSAK